MADVSALGILYLITKSIQMDCSYFILGENAIPLNMCYQHSFGAFKYECGVDNDAIYRTDYSAHECDDNDLGKNTHRINNITQHSCNNMNIPSCSSHQYAIIDTLHSTTGVHEETGVIINKCVVYSTPTGNVSRYTHCNQENQLQIWRFDDAICTNFNSVATHSLNDLYGNRNIIINSIRCPYCESNHVSPVAATAVAQPNIKMNYVVLGEAKYAFPQPINICNAFIGSHTSYKYLCIHNNVYQAIWNASRTCSGLYDAVRALSNVIDFNCLNHRANTWHYSDSARPSYITLLFDNVYSTAYITNHCIRQNDDTFVIIECQKDLMVLHYYRDDKCTQYISECMSIWHSDSVCVGDTRTAGMAHGDDVLLGIDTDVATTQQHATDADCNYVHMHRYKEAINICNPYSLYGIKHSYKFVCTQDDHSDRRRIKKRKWKNKVDCDAYGDAYDEEETIDSQILIDYQCDYKHTDVAIAEANCFENEHYFEQISIILNSCIKINDDTNSLYITCYSTFTITYYYENNDCADDFSHKEKWLGNNCESRYSEFLLDCNYPKHNASSQSPTAVPVTNSPTITPSSHDPTASILYPAFTQVPSADPAANTTSTPTSSSVSISASNTVSNPTSSIAPNPTSPTTSTGNSHHVSNPTLNSAPNPTSNPTSTTTSNSAPNPTSNPTSTTASNPAPTTTSDPAPSPTSNPTPTTTSHSAPNPTSNPTPTTTSHSARNPTSNPTSTTTSNSAPNPTSNPTPTTTSNLAPNPTSNPTSTTASNPAPTTTSDPVPNPTPPTTSDAAPNPTLDLTSTTTSDPAPNPTSNPTPTTTSDPAPYPTLNPTSTTTSNPTPLSDITPNRERNPTAQPASNSAISPTSNTVPVTTSNSVFPTETAQVLELYLYFNETRSAYWSSTQLTKTEYAEFIRRAVLLGLENVTAHSMNYQDRDLYTDKTWQVGGIVDWRNCYMFDAKLISIPPPYATCPSISSPNAHREGAQFTAVAELHVASDANTTGFKEYLVQKLESKENIHYVQQLLDRLVSSETPHQRRLLSTPQTVIIVIHALDPTKNDMYPTITKRPSISASINQPTKPTWSKVTDNAFMNPLPLQYQGLFIDQPAVSGDIFIICVIILMGMITLVGSCMWYKKNC